MLKFDYGDHIARGGKDRRRKKILEWYTRGVRKRARLVTRWKGKLKQHVGTLWRDARVRERWKRMGEAYARQWSHWITDHVSSLVSQIGKLCMCTSLFILSTYTNFCNWIKKTRLSASGHGWLTWIRFQLQWKMKFQKGGGYRRSEIKGAPHYSNNFVRCGAGVEVICHSVGVEVICHSTFWSGYRF